MRWVLILCLGLLLAAGCSEDAALVQAPPMTQTGYSAYRTPDSVASNLEVACERMDLPERRDSILYGGFEAAADGEVYAAFAFYWPTPEEPESTLYEPFEQVVQRIQYLFGGLPGQDEAGNPVPGVKSIAIELTPLGDWADPAEGTVEGDPYPVGTKWRCYLLDALITLKSAYLEDIHAWSVRDTLSLYVLPVRVADAGAPGHYHTDYRLWKVFDIAAPGRVGAPGPIKATLSCVLHMYGD